MNAFVRSSDAFQFVQHEGKEALLLEAAATHDEVH